LKETEDSIAKARKLPFLKIDEARNSSMFKQVRLEEKYFVFGQNLKISQQLS
jgi:hypothetical protein